MNNYIIDTNIFEWISDRSHPHHLACVEHLSLLSDDDVVYFPIISLYETQYSIANFPSNATEEKGRVQAALDSALGSFTLANLSTAGAVIFGELKSKYKSSLPNTKENIKKHNFDILLASISIDYAATLVSNDKIFKQIESLDSRLNTADWSTR